MRRSRRIEPPRQPHPSLPLYPAVRIAAAALDAPPISVQSAPLPCATGAHCSTVLRRAHAVATPAPPLHRPRRHAGPLHSHPSFTMALIPIIGPKTEDEPVDRLGCSRSNSIGRTLGKSSHLKDSNPCVKHNTHTQELEAHTLEASSRDGYARRQNSRTQGRKSMTIFFWVLPHAAFSVFLPLLLQ